MVFFIDDEYDMRLANQQTFALAGDSDTHLIKSTMIKHDQNSKGQ